MTQFMDKERFNQDFLLKSLTLKVSLKVEQILRNQKDQVW